MLLRNDQLQTKSNCKASRGKKGKGKKKSSAKKGNLKKGKGKERVKSKASSSKSLSPTSPSTRKRALLCRKQAEAKRAESGEPGVVGRTRAGKRKGVKAPQEVLEVEPPAKKTRASASKAKVKDQGKLDKKDVEDKKALGKAKAKAKAKAKGKPKGKAAPKKNPRCEYPLDEDPRDSPLFCQETTDILVSFAKSVGGKDVDGKAPSFKKALRAGLADLEGKYAYNIYWTRASCGLTDPVTKNSVYTFGFGGLSDVITYKTAIAAKCAEIAVTRVYIIRCVLVRKSFPRSTGTSKSSGLN